MCLVLRFLIVPADVVDGAIVLVDAHGGKENEDVNQEDADIREVGQ
jgi:hypothetical protein